MDEQQLQQGQTSPLPYILHNSLSVGSQRYEHTPVEIKINTIRLVDEAYANCFLIDVVIFHLYKSKIIPLENNYNDGKKSIA